MKSIAVSNIKIHPRSIEAMGASLVTNDNVAILELVKNAYESCIKFKPIGNGKIKHEFIPAYVNLAFACELYLKALLQSRGKETKGHLLIRLFTDLETIDKSVSDDIIKLSNIMSDLNYSEDGYKSFVKSISDTFKTWRYSYEWSKGIISINAYFFEIFSTSLYLVSENIINNLNIDYDKYKNIFKIK